MDARKKRPAPMQVNAGREADVEGPCRAEHRPAGASPAINFDNRVDLLEGGPPSAGLPPSAAPRLIYVLQPGTVVNEAMVDEAFFIADLHGRPVLLILPADMDEVQAWADWLALAMSPSPSGEVH